jgi:hypothetical protein
MDYQQRQIWPPEYDPGHGKLAVMPVRVKLCPSVMINAASTASILVPDISPITGINSGINIFVIWRAVFC